MSWKVLIAQLSFGNLTAYENAQVEDSTHQFEVGIMDLQTRAGED